MGGTRSELAALAGVGDGSPFVLVPQTTLPSGITVEPFLVARYLASRGRRARVQVDAGAAPWVNVCYYQARRVCERSGVRLLTELQALAIAHDLAGQAANWSGGAVGAGALFQGLHKGRFRSPQPAYVEPRDPLERRWHVLSTGERIYDFAGNAFSWVADDVQGDEDGIVRRTFAIDSPTVAGAPGQRLAQGLGWWPQAGRNWWGRALARGGSVTSGEGAGVFLVVDEKPRAERSHIGFRCTLPLTRAALRRLKDQAGTR
jgi:hypothetical protein